jgi:hypothetical protein
MARKPTKSPASRGRSGTRSKTSASSKARSRSASGAKSRSKGGRTKSKPEAMSASDALTGLLESPLVAEVIAAGAAAALATLTQQAISKKAEGGTSKALKMAAKAATSAMGARLASEIDEIVAGVKKSSGEAK